MAAILLCILTRGGLCVRLKQGNPNEREKSGVCSFNLSQRNKFRQYQQTGSATGNKSLHKIPTIDIILGRLNTVNNLALLK